MTKTTGNIKKGDWVEKALGHRHKGSTGLVLNVIKNGAMNTIVEVLFDGEVVYWPEQHLYVINKLNKGE